MIIRTETVTIRPVCEDELASVLDVYRHCEDFLALTPRPFASIEMVQEDMLLSRRSAGVFCGIYDTSGTMMGIVDVILQGFEYDDTSAFIELLMIGQPFRNTCLGTEVVKTVETEIMRDPKITSIWVAVMVNNPGAIR